MHCPSCGQSEMPYAAKCTCGYRYGDPIPGPTTDFVDPVVSVDIEPQSGAPAPARSLDPSPYAPPQTLPKATSENPMWEIHRKQARLFWGVSVGLGIMSALLIGAFKFQRMSPGFIGRVLGDAAYLWIAGTLISYVGGYCFPEFHRVNFRTVLLFPVFVILTYSLWVR